MEIKLIFSFFHKVIYGTEKNESKVIAYEL